MTNESILYSDLKLLQELAYDKCDLELINLKLNSESSAYGACSFELNGQKIEHRISKITPTKAGQFVTIWRRNEDGITEPFDILDDIDFVLITSRNGHKFGQFIFPKSVLADTWNESLSNLGYRDEQTSGKNTKLAGKIFCRN